MKNFRDNKYKSHQLTEKIEMGLEQRGAFELKISDFTLEFMQPSIKY